MSIKDVLILLLPAALLVSGSYGLAVTLATGAEIPVVFLRNRPIFEQWRLTLGLLSVIGGIVTLLASCLRFVGTSSHWKEK